MVNIYFLTYFTYFAYAHYYLLSVHLLQDEQTVCWQTFRSHPFCLCPFPSLFIYCRMCKQSHTLGKRLVKPTPLLMFITASWWHLQWCQLSWHISLTFTSHLWWWTFISHPFYLCPLLASICLSFAECADCLTLLARHSARSSSLLTFITPSWWHLWWHQLSWHISLNFHSSSLMVNIYISPSFFMPITIFYLSVLLQNVRTVWHSWKDVQ